MTQQSAFLLLSKIKLRIFTYKQTWTLWPLELKVINIPVLYKDFRITSYKINSVKCSKDTGVLYWKNKIIYSLINLIARMSLSFINDIKKT